MFLKSRLLTALTSATVMASMAAVSSDLPWISPRRACATRSSKRPFDVPNCSKMVTFNCALARSTSPCETEPDLSAFTAASMA